MYYISSKREDMQPDRVIELIRQTYWTKDRDESLIVKSMDSSECFGVFLAGSNRQIAFARVVTDYVSMFYISDVIVDEAYRGLGAGKALINAIVTDERFENLRGLLVTSNAHGLYEHFGFHTASDRYMVKESK